MSTGLALTPEQVRATGTISGLPGIMIFAVVGVITTVLSPIGARPFLRAIPRLPPETAGTPNGS